MPGYFNPSPGDYVDFYQSLKLRSCNLNAARLPAAILSAQPYTKIIAHTTVINLDNYCLVLGVYALQLKSYSIQNGVAYI